MSDRDVRSALRVELERIYSAQRDGRTDIQLSGLMEDVARHGSWGSERVFSVIMEAITQGILLPASTRAITRPQGSSEFGFPWLMISERGWRWVQDSKDQPDPYEADSLLEPLRARGIANPVVEAYVAEGVRTFKASAFVSTCVMLGVAAEALSEDLYEALIAHLKSPGKEKFQSALRAKRLSAEGRWNEFEARIALHESCLGDELFRRLRNVLIPHLKLFKQTRDDAAHRRPTLVDRSGALAGLYAIVPFAVTAADVRDALANTCVVP